MEKTVRGKAAHVLSQPLSVINFFCYAINDALLKITLINWEASEFSLQIFYHITDISNFPLNIVTRSLV